MQQREPGPAPPPFAPRTAIILLGGGTVYDGDMLVPPRDVLTRIKVSAETTRACKRTAATCQVIVSGGNPQRHEATEADTYLPYLLRQRVRARTSCWKTAAARRTKTRATSRPSWRIALRTLILVTSAYQMRRALLDFRCFGVAPQPLISSARHARLGVLPRYDNLVAAEMRSMNSWGSRNFTCIAQSDGSENRRKRML